jgi:hypothetical protein
MAALKPKLEPLLNAKGLEWTDILPVLNAVDSVEELASAVSDPAAFLEKLANLANMGPTEAGEIEANHTGKTERGPMTRAVESEMVPTEVEQIEAGETGTVRTETIRAVESQDDMIVGNQNNGVMKSDSIGTSAIGNEAGADAIVITTNASSANTSSDKISIGFVDAFVDDASEGVAENDLAVENMNGVAVATNTVVVAGNANDVPMDHNAAIGSNTVVAADNSNDAPMDSSATDVAVDTGTDVAADNANDVPLDNSTNTVVAADNVNDASMDHSATDVAVDAETDVDADNAKDVPVDNSTTGVAAGNESDESAGNEDKDDVVMNTENDGKTEDSVECDGAADKEDEDDVVKSNENDGKMECRTEDECAKLDTAGKGNTVQSAVDRESADEALARAIGDGEESGWACAACTLINPVSAVSCEACYIPRIPLANDAEGNGSAGGDQFVSLDKSEAPPFPRSGDQLDYLDKSETPPFPGSGSGSVLGGEQLDLDMSEATPFLGGGSGSVVGGEHFDMDDTHLKGNHSDTAEKPEGSDDDSQAVKSAAKAQAGGDDVNAGSESESSDASKPQLPSPESAGGGLSDTRRRSLSSASVAPSDTMDTAAISNVPISMLQSTSADGKVTRRMQSSSVCTPIGGDHQPQVLPTAVAMKHIPPPALEADPLIWEVPELPPVVKSLALSSPGLTDIQTNMILTILRAVMCKPMTEQFLINIDIAEEHKDDVDHYLDLAVEMAAADSKMLAASQATPPPTPPRPPCTYSSIVPHPISIECIMTRLEQGFYRHTSAVKADLVLIYINCAQYNELTRSVGFLPVGFPSVEFPSVDFPSVGFPSVGSTAIVFTSVVFISVIFPSVTFFSLHFFRYIFFPRLAILSDTHESWSKLFLRFFATTRLPLSSQAGQRMGGVAPQGSLSL